VFDDLDEAGKFGRMADALSSHFGERALCLAEKQIARAHGRPDVIAAWTRIAELLRDA
jgi:hypothetical protein